MAVRMAPETDRRMQADDAAAAFETLAPGRNAADGTELSDATLDGVAGGSQQRFYPLAELFRMITGIR